MFGASENTVGYAVDYIRVYALGTVFVQMTLGMNAYITAQGFAKVSMCTVLIGAALNIALDKLNEMRFVEGEKLKADMLARVETIEGLVAEVATRAPLVAAEYRERLTAKVQEYLADVKADEGRLLTEVAVFTDKSNIDEELTRLHSHIEQFRTIAEEGIVGRKLDFLVQEFNREANTTCSKSNDVTITRAGLALKNEIEKIREQVQNLE
jgi:uncharacterized protein (TIGR00255 family)